MNERNTSLARRWRLAVIVAGFYYIGCNTLLYWYFAALSLSNVIANDIDLSVSLPKGKPGLPRGALGLIEIRSGDRTIRIGRYLDAQQKTKIVDGLRTEMEHVLLSRG